MYGILKLSTTASFSSTKIDDDDKINGEYLLCVFNDPGICMDFFTKFGVQKHFEDNLCICGSNSQYDF